MFPRCWGLWTTALGALLVLTGCHTTCCFNGGVPNSGPEMLPLCDRHCEIVAELKPSPIQPITPAYRMLSAQQCQCLAAETSAVANMLDLEAQAGTEKAEARKLCAEKARKGASFKADVLTYWALEDRNRSAAKALDLYYRLGQTEANADIVLASLSEVQSALKKARALKAKGLQLPLDDTALHRKQLDLEAAKVKGAAQIQQFNGELRRLLAFAPIQTTWQFWPVDAFHVSDDQVDPEKAVAVGLASRPLLLLLNLLETELNEGDPATVKKMLATVNGALGQNGACPCLKKLVTQLCSPDASECERELRRQQLAIYHADREREVIEDIRQAVQNILAAKNVVVLAQQQVDSWYGRVKQAEEKESKGLGSFADTTNARMNWLKARRTLLEEITNLQRAWVQLHQAQGILSLDGHCAPSHALPSPADGARHSSFCSGPS